MFWNLWTEDYMSSTFTFLTKKILICDIWRVWKNIEEQLHHSVIIVSQKQIQTSRIGVFYKIFFSRIYIYIYIYLNSEIIFHGKNGWGCDGNTHIYHFLIAKISYFLQNDVLPKYLYDCIVLGIQKGIYWLGGAMMKNLRCIYSSVCYVRMSWLWFDELGSYLTFSRLKMHLIMGDRLNS